MNISLTPELDSYVLHKVETGMYHSASEVIREGLRLLKQRDPLTEARLHQLRKDIDVGIAQIDRGDYVEYDADNLEALANDVIKEGRRRLTNKHAGIMK